MGGGGLRPKNREIAYTCVTRDRYSPPQIECGIKLASGDFNPPYAREKDQFASKTLVHSSRQAWLHGILKRHGENKAE